MKCQLSWLSAKEGLSASLARLFSRSGMRVVLAARRPEKLDILVKETKAKAFPCDAADALLLNQDQRLGAADVVFYNLAYR